MPPAAKAEHQRDKNGGLRKDPGIDRAIAEALDWLCRAQDHSASHDGGVAHHYSLKSGWGMSYPETTGYIIPTVINAAKTGKDADLLARARRMLDWIVTLQLPEGGFQGGTVDCEPTVPVTFNTGQILLGLASGVQEFGDPYRAPLRAAAEWLVGTQDPDGCWRKYPTPFATPGEKTYETHVAWGLLEAARVDHTQLYINAAMRNVRWALSHQAPNGWFAKCCLTDPSQPLTHTIGYVLRGVIEAYRFTAEKEFLQASTKTAEGLLGAIAENGFLPGRLDERWRGTVHWACLTGTVQIAHCWLQLYQETGDVRFRDAAFAANRFVRSTMGFDSPPDMRGAVKGSFPVWGNYGQYQYLSWACKFLIDANRLEKSIRETDT